MPTLTPEIILAAIDGFQSQKAKIDAQIAELRAMLPGGSTKPATTPEYPKGTRRKMSAAVRQRMKEGQQRRWAKIRGESEATSAATPEATKPKRKLSAAGKAAIVAALKKRWAAKKAGETPSKTAVRGVSVGKTAGKKAGPAKKTAAPKKKLSPARKAALVANLAKARAAKAGKKTAGEKVQF